MKAPPEVELTISLEKLGFIILKAREFDVKVEPVEADPDASATDDEARDVLEDYADDPAYEELVDALENLNEDELAEVVALTWLGRGDYEPAIGTKPWPMQRMRATRGRSPISSAPPTSPTRSRRVSPISISRSRMWSGSICRSTPST